MSVAAPHADEPRPGTPAAASPAKVPAPLRARLGRVAASPWLWLAVVAFGVLVPLGTRLLQPPPPVLPELGQLPAFSLVDQDGQTFGKDDLVGKVWVAGFIFTRCPTICPVITATMGRIQHRARGIENQFRLVSFSVDPTYDTPAVLSAFAVKHRASPRMWKFLTGPFEAIKQTVMDGLKIAMTDKPIEGEQDFASIMHGTHFVLVDQRGVIRGYYDSDAPDVVDRVLEAAAMLINRGG
jgi:protein SCO1/2